MLVAGLYHCILLCRVVFEFLYELGKGGFF